MGVAKRYFVAVYRTNTKYSKGRHTKGSQLNIERSNSILSRTIIIQASIAMFIKDELLPATYTHTYHGSSKTNTNQRVKTTTSILRCS
ncbi:MAG: hypothetical protein M3P08_13325 [Thermoproteota archaeon]|nr:hypothetical protein [Thermoproteota archaeon]